MIKPKGAVLTVSMDWFGKMDPYVVITVGRSTQRTRTAVREGKFPHWRDILVFELNGEETIDVRVFDRDAIKADDFIGQTSIDLSQAFQYRSSECWYTLYSKSKKRVGQVKLDMDLKSQSLSSIRTMTDLLEVSISHNTRPITHTTSLPLRGNVPMIGSQEFDGLQIRQ